MDRKEFMRSVYSDYWLGARDSIYGFMPYDRWLCNQLTGAVAASGTLVEVAIGTGYPVADFLAKAGYAVHGVDISPDLVQRCRERGLPAYHVQSGADLRPEWFDGMETVGLTAGTSTLDESIDEVHQALVHMGEAVCAG